MISEKFRQDIKEHPVLMKISDCLFDRTKVYYNTLLVIQLVGFFMPLMIQIASSNENSVENVGANIVGQNEESKPVVNSTDQKRYLA